MRITFNSYDKLEKLSKLKKSRFQRNKHPKDQIERLAKIMEMHGVRHPIHVAKVNGEYLGEIAFGHGRKEAAKFNGWTEYPIVIQEFENMEEYWSCVQSDNAIAFWSELDLGGINSDLGDWGPDFDIDLLGIKDFVLEPAEKFEAQCDEDEVPEQVDTRCKPGDLWILGEHRLLCGDSTNIQHVERLMGGEKADMVFTDPPYGIDEKCDRSFASPTRMAKGNKFEQIKNDDSIDCAVDCFNLVQGLDIKRQVWWGANYYAHHVPQTGNWFVWDKRLEEKQTDNNSDCELAWVKSKWSSIRIFRHLWKGLIKGSEHGQKRVHPTQKPIALAEWCFDYYKQPFKSVLDLFGGSGSTLIACEKTGRKCYMMELDPHYCDVILSRWEKYTGKEAILNG